MSLSPPPLSRSELYRLTTLVEQLRPRPWTPALVIGGLHPAEVSFVCQAREALPAMAWQTLRANREVQDLRREVSGLEDQVADLTSQLGLAEGEAARLRQERDAAREMLAAQAQTVLV